MNAIAIGKIPGHSHGATIRCGHCGTIKTLPVKSFDHATVRDELYQKERFAERKLSELGWLVGKKEASNRCPGCYSAIKARQAVKNQSVGIMKETNVVPLTPPKPDATPREMSREDRRIIFEKLNEVYVNETTGYGPGWTDAKVATDLGVPRAWVKAVRDEMFGPEGSNEEIRATIKDAQALLGEIKALLPQLGTLTHKADVIEKRLGEIQKELR